MELVAEQLNTTSKQQRTHHSEMPFFLKDELLFFGPHVSS